MAGYRLSSALTVHWIADGDHHSLKPRKRSGRTLEQNTAAARAAAFLTAVMRRMPVS